MKKTLINILCCILSLSMYAQSGSIYAASGSDIAGTISVDWVLGSMSADGIFSSAVLPVHFGSISTTAAGNRLLVKWTTETETNNDHFDIEISGDGIHFKKMASVASKAQEGNSTTPLQYEYQANQTEIALALSLGFLCSAGFFLKRKKKYLLSAVIALLILISLAGCNKKDMELSVVETRLYLRIAQVDKDGAKTYSKTIQIVQEQ